LQKIDGKSDEPNSNTTAGSSNPFLAKDRRRDRTETTVFPDLSLKVIDFTIVQQQLFV
jgi:hypothetical protein